MQILTVYVWKVVLRCSYNISRSASPDRRAKSPAFADSTFSAVQAALNKRQLQVSDLRSKLQSLRDNHDATKMDLNDKENQLRQVTNQLMEYKQEVESA